MTEQMVKAFDVDPSEVLRVSAKTGFGLPTVLKALVERIPAPMGCTKHKPQVRVRLTDRGLRWAGLGCVCVCGR